MPDIYNTSNGQHVLVISDRERYVLAAPVVDTLPSGYGIKLPDGRYTLPHLLTGMNKKSLRECIDFDVIDIGTIQHFDSLETEDELTRDYTKAPEQDADALEGLINRMNALCFEYED